MAVILRLKMILPVEGDLLLDSSRYSSGGRHRSSRGTPLRAGPEKEPTQLGTGRFRVEGLTKHVARVLRAGNRSSLGGGNSIYRVCYIPSTPYGLHHSESDEVSGT